MRPGVLRRAFSLPVHFAERRNEELQNQRSKQDACATDGRELGGGSWPSRCYRSCKTRVLLEEARGCLATSPLRGRRSDTLLSGKPQDRLCEIPDLNFRERQLSAIHDLA